MEKTLNAAHANYEAVTGCTDHMRYLASAADALGQTRLASDLYAMAKTLDTHAKAVTSAVGADIGEHVRNADRAAQNMLAATLVACITPRAALSREGE